MRILLAAFILAMVWVTAAVADSPYTYLNKDTGGRVDWAPDGRLAYDSLDERGWFQLWIMKGDGSGKKCLTCSGNYPKLHNGNPAWHPSGKYIVYQAVDDKIPLPFWGQIYKLYTNPGGGVNNNIWIMRDDGSMAWQMTDLGKGKGVLHAHFSRDGTKLLWAEMTSHKPAPFGTWVMRLAKFAVKKGTPVLSNIRTLAPDNMIWYETHSFSPDDSEILFSGSYTGKDRPDIYKYSLTTGTLAALTDEKDDAWDEHAQFSPDGTKILWMSSKGTGAKFQSAFEPTDWWLMNADGSGKKRLTGFNDKKSADFLNQKAVAADICWSPDGREAVGYLQIGKNTMEKPGTVVRFGVE